MNVTIGVVLKALRVNGLYEQFGDLYLLQLIILKRLQIMN